MNQDQTNSALLSQMKNMKPEDWENFRKAQMQGELNLIKNGPWYYRIFFIIVGVLMVIFIIFFITRVIAAYQFQKEFDKNWNERHTQIENSSY